MSQCPHIAAAHKRIGTPAPRDRDAGFETLVRIIVDQQVSVQSGAAIWKRLNEGIASCEPDQVLDAGLDGLRALGLSKPKAGYVTGLAMAVRSGALDINGLQNLSDQVAKRHLMDIKGIGRWTAEIYLMFALGRPDIWPAGDLALAEAVKKLLSLETRPTPDQLDAIAERWKPERTAAAVFLWHCYKKLPLS